MTECLTIRLFNADVDVSKWQHKHPGGRKLLKIFHERDGTQQFISIHKGLAAYKILKSLPQKQVADVPVTTSPDDSGSLSYANAEKEFNDLLVKLAPELSVVRWQYEVIKVVYILSFFFGGYALCFYSHKYIGLSMMCLAVYQAGWVGHDYSHRSILQSPVQNNMMADFLGVIQGYSDIWWKLRHNTHHMVTNELGNDPDVRTEPVFHFYDQQSVSSSAPGGKKHPRAHIPFQQVFFVFLLCTLDIYWRYESITVLLKDLKKYKWHLARLMLNYVFHLALLLLTDVTVFNLIALSLVKGFMTAIVVFANHYPEDRLPPKHNMGLFEQTLRTSRNTTGLFFDHADWISPATQNGQGKGDTCVIRTPFMRRVFNECTGFLSMQIEHHMAPTWPSGNLMKLRPHIKALALKYNLPYHETSILKAVWENVSKLSDSTIEEIKKVQ